jgi:hypothetical protein
LCLLISPMTEQHIWQTPLAANWAPCLYLFGTPLGYYQTNCSGVFSPPDKNWKKAI